MGWLELERCCGCCRLREGCLIYGYFGAISSGAAVIFVMLALIGDSSEPEGAKLDGSVQEIRLFTPLFLVEVLFFSLLQFASYVCLLVGVHRGLPRLVYYAYVSLLVMVILYFVANIFDFSSYFLHRLVVLAFGGGFTVHMILCVRSYYFLLLDNKSVDQGLV